MTYECLPSLLTLRSTFIVRRNYYLIVNSNLRLRLRLTTFSETVVWLSIVPTICPKIGSVILIGETSSDGESQVFKIDNHYRMMISHW